MMVGDDAGASMDGMPDEVVFKLLDALDFQSLWAVSTVSRRWRALVSTDHVAVGLRVSPDAIAGATLTNYHTASGQRQIGSWQECLSDDGWTCIGVQPGCWEAGMLACASRFGGLCAVLFTGCVGGVTSQTLTALIGARDLVMLSFARSPVDDAGLCAIGAHGRRLRSLSLQTWSPWSARHGVTDLGVAAVALGCSMLESIRLESCDAVTDVGVEALAASCRHLTSVTLYDTRVGEPAIAAICANCRLLRVDLSCSGLGSRDRVTDAWLLHLATCSQLESLALDRCRKTTIVGLRRLVEGCPQLRSVSLGWNTQLEDGWLKLLAKLKGLRTLHLLCCGNVTDSGLAAIGDAYGQLETLSLDQSIQISAGGLAQLESCPKLRRISLEDCPQISNAALLDALASCPQLDTVILPDGRSTAVARANRREAAPSHQ